MKQPRFIKKLSAFSLLFLLVGCSRGTATEAEILNVYNSADYIAEDDPETGDKGIISLFEDYMKSQGRNVKVSYSTFDTNETMLSELKTGKAHYDLICPSDYVIQKMMAEDLIIPFDHDSTPDYNANVSPFVNEKMSAITVDYDGEERSVADFARGYMWGTLGVLYNNGFKGIPNSVSPEEMDEDMHDWNSLWDDKYKNLLAIKDSVRDTYAVGVFKTFDEELEALKETYEASDQGTEAQQIYNKGVTEIFNRCDDKTINEVGENLRTLRANSFGFEVDSGKSDMARGANFAINIAWSGDAAWAMDMADENNEANAENPSFVPTNLKYVLPDTGANIWFDGWVMPQGAKKELAEEFVNFLSMPENAALNMDYIGYTPVIAGDDILSLVQSYYDIRYDEESEGLDESVLDDLTEVSPDEIENLTDEELEESYYKKDISYFFQGTLTDHEDSEAVFCLSADSKDTQFDTQYPDVTLLPKLAVMADFGAQNANMLLMWESVKNTTLPVWSYYLILAAILALICFGLTMKIHKANVRKRRKLRHQQMKL